MTAVVAPIRYTPRTTVTRPTPIGSMPALPAVYVHPGQLAVGSGPGVMTTILGSCVAVCLHDPRLGLGGINHYLLPNHGADSVQTGRYGPTAIEQLVRMMLDRGASRDRLVAHVVGGARVLAAFSDAQHLGLRNATVAREILTHHHIPIVSADVGGTRGRKLMFAPREGNVAVQVIGS